MEVKRKFYDIMTKVKELGGTRCILALAITTAKKSTSLKEQYFYLIQGNYSFLFSQFLEEAGFMHSYSSLLKSKVSFMWHRF